MLDERPSLEQTLRLPTSHVREEEDDVKSFSSGRVGSKPQLTVTFRQVDGSSYSFAYSHLYSLMTEAEAGGFIAEFSQHRVIVQGRNLTQLFRYLCDHKIHTVQEISPSQGMAIAEHLAVVTSIRVSRIEP